MPNKYKKVSDMDVLKKYYNIQYEMNKVGCWCDYVSINWLAKELETSKYQIQKAYKSLKEQRIYKTRANTNILRRIRQRVILRNHTNIV